MPTLKASLITSRVIHENTALISFLLVLLYQMLGNVVKNISLLGNKNILLGRYNLTRAMLENIRNKQSMVSSKASRDLRETTETDNIDETDQPIKYSSSKAATMRIDEYRNPHEDNIPWYQGHCVMYSIFVFLIYFCILREENDIDLLLYNDLGDTLNQLEKKSAK